MTRARPAALALAAGLSLCGWVPAGRAGAQETPPGFRKYMFVLLWAGPNRGGTPEEIERIQRGHLENIARLQREGKLAIAGPFEDGGKLRGVFILNVQTKEAAQALLATDPAIQTGRLSAQILTWWSESGRTLPP